VTTDAHRQKLFAAFETAMTVGDLAALARTAFNAGAGWNVASIEPDRVQTRCYDDGVSAWLATIKRI
jgi:hypothetical protein